MTPRYVRVTDFELVRDGVRCFADYFEQTFSGPLPYSVAVERLTSFGDQRCKLPSGLEDIGDP